MINFLHKETLSSRITERLREEQTPFYLYDMELLQATLDSLNDATERHGYIVHYAMKANFENHILEAIKRNGLGVDCVSGNEVKHAIELGFPASSIVFAGVGKSDREIRYAIEQEIFAFNCESREELQIIDSIAAELGKVVKVALRINPDVDPMTHRYISTGGGESKFGISYREIELLTEELDKMKNVNITGLHFHVGSQIRELRVFKYLCLRVNTLYKWFTEQGFELNHVNLGGGLGVNYINPESELIPNFEAYFNIFHENLKLSGNVDLHFELGRSLVAQCGELISRVLFNKTTANRKNVVIIDASMTELIRPALYEAHHKIENLDATPDLPTVEYIVAGTACESSDVFAESIRLPELKRGNLVSIKSAGAYGSAMASRYNMHDLPRSLYSDKL